MKKLFQAIMLATIPFTFIGCEKDYDLLADYVVQKDSVESIEVRALDRTYHLEITANVSVKKADGTILRLKNSSVNVQTTLDIETSAKGADQDSSTTKSVSLNQALATDEKGKITFNYDIEVPAGHYISGISTEEIRISGEHGGAFYQTSISLGNSLWSKITDYSSVLYNYDPEISTTPNSALNTLETKIELNKTIILEGLGDHSLYLPKVNNLRRALGKRPSLILNNGISFSPVREI